MARIVGTIISVGDFLSKKRICLSVNSNSPQDQQILLESDRIYLIPAFQREIRWDDNNLKTLLSDLARGSRFLGNVILTLRRENICEIIDGQQRTTVLMLIIACINEKYGEQICLPDLCSLKNESFTGLQTLMTVAFDKSKCASITEWDEALKSDDYHQFHRINKLWQTIYASEFLSDRYKAQHLLENICNSEVNIIASYSDDDNASIQYFLDVNLKGIRLDTEDIFKGNLFSQDSCEETRNLWQKNKCDALRLNNVEESTDEKRYPLMKLYEHFFYCDLYLKRGDTCEYDELKFGENFCLTTEFENGHTKLYEGSHLIEAIRDKSYLKSVLERLSKCVEVMIDIVENEAPSTTFKKKFKCEQNGDSVDSIDIGNIHSMLKKILLEKEIIPKILALKYILTYLIDGKARRKDEYKSAYSVFCASILFTVYANKKESETFYKFVRDDDWVGRINEWLYNYISSRELTIGKIIAAYRYSEGSTDSIQSYRCKSLASIINYFKIAKAGDKYILHISNANELNKFFNDNDTYSLEHFIIGESGTAKIKYRREEFDYKYPAQIQRYKNSLFNFIFIPELVNNKLSNAGLLTKIDELHAHKDEIKCDYSKGYFDLLDSPQRQYFKEYPNQSKIDSCESKEEVFALLDDYFKKTFPDEFLHFSKAVTQKIKWNS